ncbi:TPA: hypothetical protein SIA35_003575 [Aeromonas sobria]|nr:hypothetical protein [Aeromonas sobria]
MKGLFIGAMLFSPFLYAETCSLPKSISGKRVLAENIQPYSAANPMSDDIYDMLFHANGEYEFTTLSTNLNSGGKYNYRMLDSDTAIISATADYMGKPVTYTMTFTCNSERGGFYIYKQTLGEGAERSNVSRYFILDK